MIQFNLEKKWFDKIKSGEKKIEYREFNKNNKDITIFEYFFDYSKVALWNSRNFDLCQHIYNICPKMTY